MSNQECCEGGPLTAGCYHDNCKGPKRKVRVRMCPPGCCGVIRQGHEGLVNQAVYVPECNDAILILEDGALVWAKDVQDVTTNAKSRSTPRSKRTS